MNISKRFLVYRKVTGAETPQLTDNQLNKLFTVAIKPKDLSEKNSLVQLFRCYRSKKNTKAEVRSHTQVEEKSIEKNVVDPLKKVKPYSIKPEVGFEGMIVNPMTKEAVFKDLLWSKQPLRPATRAKPRFNPYEDKRHKSLLNRSDYR